MLSTEERALFTRLFASLYELETLVKVKAEKDALNTHRFRLALRQCTEERDELTAQLAIANSVCSEAGIDLGKHF